MLIKSYSLSLLFLLVISLNSLWAQESNVAHLNANNTDEVPVIDGLLDEAVWQNASSTKGAFIQSSPNNGEASTSITEVIVLYNDFSIYVGAKLYDNEPNEIRAELGLRDDLERNADRFSIGFDTYLNRQNAFLFMVTAAGVQADAYATPSDEDFNWNAVWSSAVAMTDFGWSVEIEIPYSALRFPKKEVQSWGVNFGRVVKRYQEESYWHPINPNLNGVVNQFGTLDGLEGIKPPLRLQLTPYVTGYLQKEPGQNVWGTSLTGGMDLKYGINESFTLDMSLIPDFGQVRSDNVVLNLSPYEVRFDENRPFFTEGTELFNTRGNQFYSRRVGEVHGLEPTLGEDEILTGGAPGIAPLVNATKVSGRTKSGLGIGFFNAVTNRSYATARDTLNGNEREVVVDPLTNFNVVVFDQNLRNNSNISVLNTNVSRTDGGRNANVTGGAYSFFDKTNTWNIAGTMGLSQIWQKEDGETGNQPDVGYAYSVEVGKVSGNWQFQLERQVESDNYQINDMGFLRAPNEVSHGLEFGYRKNEPFWKLNSFSSEIEVFHMQTFLPREFDNMSLSWSTDATWNNFWNTGFGIGGNPMESQNHFEARTPGYIFRKAKSYRLYAYASTDSRKQFQLSGNTGFWQRPEWEQTDTWMSLNPRFRVNNKLTLNHNIFLMKRRAEIGYVKRFAQANDDWQIIMGRRDVFNVTNLFTTSYTFNQMMGLNLRIRHYWSKVDYNDFYDLSRDGYLLETDYNGINTDGVEIDDTNFNAFNIDLVYNWQFAPGSFLSLVWKNQIYTFGNDISPAYFENLAETWRSPQQNSLSLRVIYFLDYFNVQRALKR
ncbi:MAG: DUF5916 domain-containing protein [Bacteroidia bacterium]